MPCVIAVAAVFALLVLRMLLGLDRSKRETFVMSQIGTDAQPNARRARPRADDRLAPSPAEEIDRKRLEREYWRRRLLTVLRGAKW